MKRNLTRSIAWLLTLTALLSLAACAKESYRNDVALADLSAAAEAALPAQAYSNADEGFLDDYFMIPGYVTDVKLRFSTEGNNLDEYGIYHVTNGNAEAMKQLLEGYLEQSYAANRDWYDSYIPEETPKLRDAEVRVYGNYVVYAICADGDRAALFDSIKALLKE